MQADVQVEPKSPDMEVWFIDLLVQPFDPNCSQAQTLILQIAQQKLFKLWNTTLFLIYSSTGFLRYIIRKQVLEKKMYVSASLWIKAL